jgi:hypothetical protein
MANAVGSAAARAVESGARVLSCGLIVKDATLPVAFISRKSDTSFAAKKHAWSTGLRVMNDGFRPIVVVVVLVVVSFVAVAVEERFRKVLFPGSYSSTVILPAYPK